MVTHQSLTAFAATCALIVAAPGPNHLFILHRSLAMGRRAGLISACGIETGLIIHIGACVAGLSYAISRSGPAFAVLRIIGALYLTWLGVRCLRHHCTTGGRHRHGSTASKPDLPARHYLRRTYAAGVAVALTNPKALIVIAALLPQFIQPAAGHIATQSGELGLVLLALSLPLDWTYAFSGGPLGRLLAQRPAVACAQQTLTGVIYLTLAVTTALTTHVPTG